MYMLFQKLNNIQYEFIDMNMSYNKSTCHIGRLHDVDSLKKITCRIRKIICRSSFFNIIIH